VPLLHHSCVVSAAAQVNVAMHAQTADQIHTAETGLSGCFVLVDARGVLGGDGGSVEGSGKGKTEEGTEQTQQHEPQMQALPSSRAIAPSLAPVRVSALARLLDTIWDCLGISWEGEGLGGAQKGGSAFMALSATSSLVVVVGCLVGLISAEGMDASVGARAHLHELPQGERQAEAAAVSVLADIAASRAGPCLWPLLGWGCNGNAGGGMDEGGAFVVPGKREVVADSTRCALCGALAWVLQRCEPQLHAALYGHAGKLEVSYSICIQSILQGVMGVDCL